MARAMAKSRPHGGAVLDPGNGPADTHTALARPSRSDAADGYGAAPDQDRRVRLGGSTARTCRADRARGRWSAQGTPGRSVIGSGKNPLRGRRAGPTGPTGRDHAN